MISLKKKCIATGLVVLIAITGCSTENENSKEDVFQVDIAKPVIGNVEVNGDFIGTISADTEVMIIPMAAGNVTNVYFDVGDHVNKGDLLFTIDDKAAQIQMAQAQAGYDASKLGISSAQAGLTLNTFSVLNTQAQVNQSLGTIDSTREQLESAYEKTKAAYELLQNNPSAAADGKIVTKDDVKAAKRALEDYDDYTVPVIESGAALQQGSAYVNTVNAINGVEQANIAARQAAAGIQGAKLQLDYTKVTSPIAGTVTSKNVSVNNMVSQTQPAYIITSDGVRNVEFNVSETVMQTIQINDSVEVERNGQSFKATVTENSGIRDIQSGLFKIKAAIAGALDISTGSKVKLSLITRRASSVITVPVDSVYYENHSAYVFTEKDGVAVKTPIETGLTDNEVIEVTKGLTKDSKVITTWHSRLADGSKVSSK